MFLHHPDFRGVEYDGEGVWDAEGGEQIHHEYCI